MNKYSVTWGLWQIGVVNEVVFYWFVERYRQHVCAHCEPIEKSRIKWNEMKKKEWKSYVVYPTLLVLERSPTTVPFNLLPSHSNLCLSHDFFAFISILFHCVAFFYWIFFNFFQLKVIFFIEKHLIFFKMFLFYHFYITKFNVMFFKFNSFVF